MNGLSDRMQTLMVSAGLVFVGASIFAPVDSTTREAAFAVGVALVAGKELPGTIQAQTQTETQKPAASGQA